MNKTIVIAEAGVNHNGDINLAKKLIDVASDSGADYIEFQTFKVEKISAYDAKKLIIKLKIRLIKKKLSLKCLKD